MCATPLEPRSPGSAPGVDAVAFLGSTRLFAGLAAGELEQLARFTHVRTVRRGEYVFHQGDPGDTLYIVVSGLVKVFVTSADGAEMVLVTLAPRDTFGELVAVDGGPRSASAQAVEDTTLVALSRGALLDALRDHPQIADALLRAMGALLRRLTDQAADLVFLDLHGRVAKLICGLCDQQGGATTLDLQLTQSELASMVGGSRQSVNQILRTFEQAGLLEAHGRKMIVLRPDLLRRRAGLD
jgi:CRP-like cAMP-binding protein